MPGLANRRKGLYRGRGQTLTDRHMDKTQTLKEKVLEQNIKVHAEEARVYERLHPQLFNWYHRKKSQNDIGFILASFDTKLDIEVLDLGCGTGFLTTKIMRSPKVRATAVDLSPEMLSELEKKIEPLWIGRISLINKEAMEFLRSDRARYDIIMASAFFHHVVDFKEFFDVILARLKPGGLFYIAYEPLKQSIDSKVKFILHRCIRALDMAIFKFRLKMEGITLDHSHERSMADYQTILGGIDPVDVIGYLKKHGDIVKFDKFSTRANGVLAFISDKIIRSQNTFSITFRKP